MRAPPPAVHNPRLDQSRQQSHRRRKCGAILDYRQMPRVGRDTDFVRVQDKGRISFRGRELRVSRGFIGQPVGLRPVGDGIWDVYYGHQKIGQLDLTC